MSRLDRSDAHNLADHYRIPLAVDYHTLDSATVERLVAAADSVRYRAPRVRNGSRARYFHAYLQRATGKEHST